MCRATTKEWGVLKLITLGHHPSEAIILQNLAPRAVTQTKCPPPWSHIANWLVKMQNSWW
jgi:hypothetical protein